MENISVDEFFGNILTHDISESNILDKINSGIRISKVFKIVFDKLTPSLLDRIQTIYSTYLQKNKIEGYLVLSVHPLDFLSASENRYNWRSCHSLDGEYGLGNIQYMKDDITFMGYLLTVDDYDFILPNFPDDILWNSKIWRTYFFLKDDVLMRGNSYPYTSEEIVDKFTSAIVDTGLLPKDENAEWYTLDINNEDYDYPYYGVRTKFINYGLDQQLYFNDLVDHSKYVPRAYFNKEKYPSEVNFPRFKLGKDLLCFRCGDRSIEIHNGLCSRCYNNDDY